MKKTICSSLALFCLLKTAEACSTCGGGKKNTTAPANNATDYEALYKDLLIKYEDCGCQPVGSGNNQTEVDEGCKETDKKGACTECKRGYWTYLEDDLLRCAKTCPADLYPSFKDRWCLECDPRWEGCGLNENPGCQAESYGYCDWKNHWKNTTCEDQCPDGYFGRRGWCHKCSDNCKDCDGFDTCNKCDDYFRLNEEGGCVDSCEADNQYVNKTGACVDCHESCGTCGQNATNCLTCAEGYEFDEDNVCTLQVVGGSNECPRGCVDCDNDGSCNQCGDNYLLFQNGTEPAECRRRCPEGYTEAANSNVCVECSVNNCAVCSANGQCSECKDDFFLTNDGKCNAQCPSGFFPALDENSEAGSCKQCGYKCLNCDSADSCNKCLNGQNIITSVKPALSTKEFQEAISEGVNCRGSLACPANHTFFNNLLKTCQSAPVGCAAVDKKGNCIEKCDSTCGDCFGNATNCISCNAGDFLVKLADGNSTCRPKCDDGEFYDAEEKICSSCIDNCDMCGNSTECLQCSAGFFYYEGARRNRCVEECPEGTFADEAGNCQSCPAGCATCESGNLCTSCNAFTELGDDDQCNCQFNYEIKARPTFQYVQVDFYNLQWDINTTNITSGKRFNCSDVFEFDNESDADFDLSALRCYGRDLSSDEQLRQRITIRSSDIEVLNLLVNEDVKIAVNSTIVNQDCVGGDDLDYTLDFPSATGSCSSCGKDGDL